jgi:hypothetical protein
MNEGTAVEKLDELISESQSTPAEAPKLFPLDQAEIVRELEVVYDEDTKITLYHKLRWPEFKDLNDRQRQTPYRTRLLGGGKTTSQNEDGVTANALLWDKCRRQVKGYEWNGIDADQWVDVSDDLAEEIPDEHKSEAIIGLFESQFEVEMPKGKGYVLGVQVYKVIQTYGPYTIYHYFRKPSDGDRRSISRKAYEVQNTPGATRGMREVFTNLKPYCESYDKNFERLEGVKSVNDADPNIAHRKDLISPLWKLGAMDALMEAFAAPRRDLSKN